MNAEGVERQSDELLAAVLARNARGGVGTLAVQIPRRTCQAAHQSYHRQQTVGVRVTDTLSRESHDTEDVHSEAITHLLARLDNCKSNPNGNAIDG